MNHYHDTTNENNPVYEKKAASQDAQVLDFIKGYKHPVTASFIHGQIFTKFVPLTSVRRALTNLANEGFIEKVGKQKGPYGRPEFTWRMMTNTCVFCKREFEGPGAICSNACNDAAKSYYNQE